MIAVDPQFAELTDDHDHGPSSRLLLLSTERQQGPAQWRRSGMVTLVAQPFDRRRR
jgi:hypothetical protein